MATTTKTQHKATHATTMSRLGHALRKTWRDQVAAQEALLELNGPRIRSHR